MSRRCAPAAFFSRRPSIGWVITASATAPRIALGEFAILVPARLLADALRDPSVDRAHLDWAFSTLYAVPADWSGTDDFVETLIDGDLEVSARLL